MQQKFLNLQAILPMETLMRMHYRIESKPLLSGSKPHKNSMIQSPLPKAVSSPTPSAKGKNRTKGFIGWLSADGELVVEAR